MLAMPIGSVSGLARTHPLTDVSLISLSVYNSLFEVI